MYNIITGNSTDNRINLLKNFYFMILSDFPALIDAGLRYFHYGHAAIGLNVRLAMLGCETAEFPDYEWNGMERGDTEFLVWQATISGCGELEYEGRLVPVPPGTAMWVRIPGDGGTTEWTLTATDGTAVAQGRAQADGNWQPLEGAQAAKGLYLLTVRCGQTAKTVKFMAR